jgi:hypothetical protein
MFEKLYNYYNSLYDLILKKTCKKQEIHEHIEKEEEKKKQTNCSESNTNLSGTVMR